MKVLLTGIAGTGKSTIVKALQEKGIQALDLHDVPELFFWQDKETKKKVEYRPVESRDWFDTVDRLCDIPKLQQILSQYESVVAAGTTSGGNQNEFFSQFDKVLLLQASPETILQRMQTRTNKSGFGKSKAEQDDNIDWQKEFDPEMLSLGAIPVSTEGELADVAEAIITLVR